MEEFYWHSIEPKVSEIDQRIRREVENRLEYALRHLVTPPIKGDITRGKIRWRGIYMDTVVLNDDVFNTKILSDGRLDVPRNVGHTIELHYQMEVKLFQRDKEIPLLFDSETEADFTRWCIMRQSQKKITDAIKQIKSTGR